MATPMVEDSTLEDDQLASMTIEEIFLESHRLDNAIKSLVLKVLSLSLSLSITYIYV
jgi:hypothetical protein